MKINVRIILIVVVLSVSAFVFEIGCNVAVNDEIKKENNQTGVTNWLICSNVFECPKEEKIVDTVEKKKIKEYSVYNSNSQIRIVPFNEKTTKGLKIKEGEYGDQNVAILNTEYQELAFKNNGAEYINYAREQYKVVGKYTEKKDSKLDEVMFFISSHSKGIKSVNLFDVVEVKTKDNIKKSEMKKIGKKIFGDALVEKNTKNDSSRIDFGSFVFMLLIMLGVFVVLNAIGFVQEWIHFQKKELIIRKMVGGSRKKLAFLLYRRFIVLCGFSALAGTVISYLAIKMLDYSNMTATRNLIGEQLFFKAIVLGVILLLLCGFVLLGMNLVFGKKRIFKTNSKGGYSL